MIAKYNIAILVGSYQLMISTDHMGDTALVACKHLIRILVNLRLFQIHIIKDIERAVQSDGCHTQPILHTHCLDTHHLIVYMLNLIDSEYLHTLPSLLFPYLDTPISRTSHQQPTPIHHPPQIQNTQIMSLLNRLLQLWTSTAVNLDRFVITYSSKTLTSGIEPDCIDDTLMVLESVVQLERRPIVHLDSLVLSCDTEFEGPLWFDIDW